MKQFILSVILILTLSSTANSTVYYVSASGNDSNNGTDQSTPWQTISKVNSMMASVNAGDQIADLSDISIVYNNASRFIVRSRP